MKSPFYASVEDAVSCLKNVKTKFVSMMANGDMSVEYYAPEKIDLQKPHDKDEVYIIAAGYSEFVRDAEIINCKTGDVIFVPAGMEHRFINFSTDFATWVIFYGEVKN